MADDRRTEPNNDPATMPMFDSDDAPVYHGLESVVPDTTQQVAATEQPQEHVAEEPVGIEVIDAHELAKELWPGTPSPGPEHREPPA